MCWIVHCESALHATSADTEKKRSGMTPARQLDAKAKEASQSGSLGRRFRRCLAVAFQVAVTFGGHEPRPSSN
jgi:hypothetical protein